MKAYYKKAVIALLLIWIVSGCATARKKPPLPPPSKPEVRKEIVKTALSLKGRPYKKKAKGPGAFDCSGFVQYVYKKVKINLPPTTKEQSKVGQKIPVNEVRSGDLVFFRNIRVFHVGIMLNKKEFIHSSTLKGISIDCLDAAYWKKKRAYFRRVL